MLKSEYIYLRTFVRKIFNKYKVRLMIYNRNLLYLEKQKAKQTFANLPKFGFIHEGLFRLYTSWRSVETELRKKFVT